MGHPYLPILILIAFAVVFVAAFVTLSTYECGVEPQTTARQRFSVHFYLVAIVFILFDIEAVFLFPWAVGYRELTRELGLFMFAEMAVFVAILFLGYFYVWRRGVLDWSTHELRQEMLKRHEEMDKAA